MKRRRRSTCVAAGLPATARTACLNGKLSRTPPSTKNVWSTGEPASSYTRQNSAGNCCLACSCWMSASAVAGNAPGKHDVARAAKASAGLCVLSRLPTRSRSWNSKTCLLTTVLIAGGSAIGIWRL